MSYSFIAPKYKYVVKLLYINGLICNNAVWKEIVPSCKYTPIEQTRSYELAYIGIGYVIRMRQQ